MNIIIKGKILFIELIENTIKEQAIKLSNYNAHLKGLKKSNSKA